MGRPLHTRAQLVWWTMPIRNSIGNRMSSLVTGSMNIDDDEHLLVPPPTTTGSLHTNSLNCLYLTRTTSSYCRYPLSLPKRRVVGSTSRRWSFLREKKQVSESRSIGSGQLCRRRSAHKCNKPNNFLGCDGTRATNTTTTSRAVVIYGRLSS